jgi:flagellar biosynthesis/type III secretory pathway M-ring protein FliF/YscJ
MDNKELKDEFSEKDELTPDQLKRLDESLKQLRNGQWISHEEVSKLVRAWLQTKMN